MHSLEPLYLHSMSTLGTTAPIFLYGNRRSQMTGEGNAFMAPSPVDSAPGELTVIGHDEQDD